MTDKMQTEVTEAVRRAAETLRDSLNVCGDARKCQCGDAVSMSEATMTDALAAALDVEEIAQELYRVLDGRLPWSHLSANERGYYRDKAPEFRSAILGEEP